MSASRTASSRPSGKGLGAGDARDRRRRQAGIAGRHRQPLPYRAALLGRGRLRRRFLQRDGVGGVRRHDDRDPVRRAASRPVAAPGRRGVSRGGPAQGGHRLRLSPDHHRPDRAGHGPGIAGADPRRLHLVQGLHDLRSAAARRRADARHPGGGAARGRARHGSCREPRHDQMADRAGCSERGLGAPRYHAVSHARLAEGEATNRAVALVAIARRADPAGPRLGRPRRST